MRIGNIRIKGISKRFYFIAGGLVLLLIIASFFGGSSPKPNTLLIPAFPESKLTTSTALQTPGWTGGLISANGLFQPTQTTDFTGLGYAAHVGLPVRFKVFLYSPSSVQTARSDLIIQKDGYNFEPAEFLPPNQPTSLSNLSSNTNTLPTQPLELGFRQSETPPPGTAYEITGLLWWRTDLLNPSGTSQSQGAPPLASPIILVDSYQELSDAELRAPATQSLNLALNYQEGNTALSISDIEWSSGNEMRVCVTLTNTTAQPIPIWPGVSSMTADVGQGSVTGSPDTASALSTTSQLQPHQAIPGYVVFGSSVADSNQPITLRMPDLQSPGTLSTTGQQDSIIVQVPQSAIANVATSQTPTTNCGTGTSANNSSGGSSGSSGGGSETGAGNGTVGTNLGG